jgi:hypothetical protein
MSASPAPEGQQQWVRAQVFPLCCLVAYTFSEGVQERRRKSVLVPCGHEAVGVGEARGSQGELQDVYEEFKLTCYSRPLRLVHTRNTREANSAARDGQDGLEEVQLEGQRVLCQLVDQGDSCKLVQVRR